MKTENLERIQKALEDGNIIDIEFSKDGSCVRFYFKYLNRRYDHIETQLITLRTELAMPLLHGFRFVQHELKTCY